MNTNPAPRIIHDLVERFERNFEAYKSGTYNETQVRRYAWSAKLPLSIVEYIVKNTVGPLVGAWPWPAPVATEIKGGRTEAGPTEKGGRTGAGPTEKGGRAGAGPTEKGGRAKAAPLPKPLTPTEAAKLRILDPACGSGSFLLGAYQYLLDWHLAWYANNDPEKWAKQKEPRICSVGARACPAPVATEIKGGRAEAGPLRKRNCAY